MKESPSLCRPVSIPLRGTAGSNGIGWEYGIDGSHRKTDRQEISAIRKVGGGLRDSRAAAWNGTTASMAAPNIAAEGLGAARASKFSVECRQTAVAQITAVVDPHVRAVGSDNIANYLAAGIVDPEGAVDSRFDYAAYVGVA